jgi:hypothetical protein
MNDLIIKATTLLEANKVQVIIGWQRPCKPYTGNFYYPGSRLRKPDF